MGTEITTLQTAAKITPRAAASVAAVLTPPSGATPPAGGQIVGGAFNAGLSPANLSRRGLLRLTISAAGSFTNGAVFAYVDGVWCRVTTIPDQTFGATDLVHAVVIDLMVGSGFDIAGTLSGGTITADLYPLEVQG